MKRWSIAVALLAYLVAVVFCRPHPTPGPQLRDFEAYYAAGVTWNEGVDPYSTAIWSAERAIPDVNAQRDELLPYINPPVLLPALSLYARLPYGTAAVAWSVMLGLALLLLVGALLALAGRAGEPWTWAALVVAALAFGPISSDLSLGQFALIGVAAVAVASLGFTRDEHTRPAIATLVAGLAPTFAFVLLSWMRNWRNVVAAAAGLSAFAIAWGWLRHDGNVPTLTRYVQLLSAHGAAEGFSLIQFTTAAIAHGLGARDTFAVGLQCMAIGLALIAALAIAWYRRATPLAVFAAACALTPLALPFFHEHDFALLFIPAFLALAYSTTRGARLVALLALLLVGVDWLGVAQRPDGVVQTLLVALALTAAAFGLTGIRHARELVPLACAAIAIVVVGALARGHALPIWPDAMGSIQLARDATVAQTWHAEQVASGMLVPNALAAVLRTLPLIGAALLAYLSARLPQGLAGSKIPSRDPAAGR